MLGNIIEKIERAGLEGCIYSDFTCEPVAKLLEYGVKEFELRKAIAPHVPRLLETTIERYKAEKEVRTQLDLITVERALEKYNQGDIVRIDELSFFDATKQPYETKQYCMNPLINSLGSGMIWAGLGILISTLPLIGTEVNAEYIRPVQSALINLGFGLKFLNKAYKEAKDGSYDWNGIKNTVAGVGLMTIPIPPETLMAMPGLAFYTITAANYTGLITVFSRFFRALGRRERIMDPLPGIEEIKEDLIRQIAVYKKVKEKYSGEEFKSIDEKNFNEEANLLNLYLRYHLQNIGLDRIHFDWDHVTGKVLGATARADIFVDTAEFSSEKMKEMDAPLFAKVYAHEVAHLDGVMNEGRANLRADKVLEDLAIYQPDSGYDLQLEIGKLISIGHAYTLLLNLGKGQPIPPEMLKRHLMSFGLEPAPNELPKELRNQLNKNHPLESIIGWTYNKKRVLLRLQSVVGGSNPNSGYTIDHYKLLKKANMI